MLAKLEPNWILIKSIDCGDEAAEWLNTCLRKSSLRLIRAEYEITDKSILNRNDVLILNEEDVENWDFTALTHCVVVTQESLEMFYYSDPLAVKLRPHILISSPGYPAFAEQTWEWIKIGNVITRNLMPVLRCVYIVCYVAQRIKYLLDVFFVQIQYSEK
ncbi:PREDICTED: mitochondrial amidoxime reducing component 2-like isoform X1 [Vollenhovia emeryi]|uniref:mitochondrial amidoxime reducing component 2-like isoform X1 n=1 Tax=Vollenhovia emeryi TaxID=411798 RepID=UPI0005F55F20|nr:PREDICTED: mitochondrial amidoxime reducing component 2-like isoform X1 [Vollenhovia emeryi]